MDLRARLPPNLRADNSLPLELFLKAWLSPRPLQSWQQLPEGENTAQKVGLHGRSIGFSDTYANFQATVVSPICEIYLSHERDHLNPAQNFGRSQDPRNFEGTSSSTWLICQGQSLALHSMWSRSWSVKSNFIRKAFPDHPI